MTVLGDIAQARNLLGGRLLRSVEFLINLVLLSILVLVTSVGVITMYAAVIAAHGVVRDWARLGETSVIRPFVRHLRRHVGAGIALVVPFVLPLVIGWCDLNWVIHIRPTQLRWPILLVTVAFIAVFLAISAVLPAVLVHYESSVPAALRYAAGTALARPLSSIACVAVIALTVIIGVVVPISPLITVGISVWLMHRIWSAVFATDEASGANPSPAG